MDPNATGYPAMQHNTGYPVTTQGQQYPFYPNAVPSSFPQPKTPSQHPQQHQHSFGAVPLQPGGTGGAMMPSGYPQHSSGPPTNFSAPFTQPPVPTQYMPPQGTSTSNLPTTAAQALHQNMTSVSANNALPTQQQQQKPVQQPNQSQASSQAAGQRPLAAREKARVSTLLDINSMLLQEVVNLQAAGKAGGPPTQSGSQESNPSPTSDQVSDSAKGATQKPSPEYIECMRRLQANLAYLATIADRAKKSGGVAPSAPAILTPPPNMPSMNEIYNKLNELFQRTGKGSTGSPQAAQGNGKASPSPVGESVI